MEGRRTIINMLLLFSTKAYIIGLMRKYPEEKFLVLVVLQATGLTSRWTFVISKNKYFQIVISYEWR